MQRKSKNYPIICVQFLTELQRPGLHQAYMARQVTLLVPTNAAMAEYRGRRGEDLVLNHVINQIVLEEALVTGARLSSLVVGSPPLWVTRRLELQTNLREDFTITEKAPKTWSPGQKHLLALSVRGSGGFKNLC